jgi:hypothetical protein
MCRVSTRRLFTILHGDGIWTNSTQNPKKINLISNLPIKTNIFAKNTKFRTLNVEKSQKYVCGLPDGICRLDPKS